MRNSMSMRVGYSRCFRQLRFFFFFSSRRRHTRSLCDWSSDVCSSDLRGADAHHPVAVLQEPDEFADGAGRQGGARDDVDDAAGGPRVAVHGSRSYRGGSGPHRYRTRTVPASDWSRGTRMVGGWKRCRLVAVLGTLIATVFVDGAVALADPVGTVRGAAAPNAVRDRY